MLDAIQGQIVQCCLHAQENIREDDTSSLMSFVPINFIKLVYYIYIYIYRTILELTSL